MKLCWGLLVVVLALEAGCGPQPAGPGNGTPTPTPTVQPTGTPTPAPTPTPVPCAQTASFEVPNAPDVGASFTMLVAGDTVDGFAIDTGSIDVVGGPYWVAACGTQSMDLSGGEPGTIHRDFPTSAGAAYRVRFAFSGNPYDDTEVKVVRAYWNGALLEELSFFTDGFGPENMGWKFYDYDVTATGASGRLTFESITPGVYGPALDAISVSPL